ncbi:DUF3632 domain-containing protein [Aspergillus alliaceus]|uniref:DUF3632 domain-containing protein n=1 Tax=Petromyces alliaceus TaxID=209559 RepID=UPI0012A57942|nr:uncharacterized protein BDW43DRAFT_134364 [Aspergillus alliaceus]KAB8231849.1 hypothetical protein BDW43DRAFT_134364 [Aspergillus alliaceus]
MEDLLTSSPPKGKPSPYNVDLSPGHRASERDAACQGQFDDLRSAANNKVWMISERYCQIGDGVDSFEPTLHDLWYGYSLSGRYLHHESAEHDRLVLDVLRIRGRGPLARPVRGLYGIDIARTPVGAIWNDLPYFVDGMTEHWVNECASLDASQRLNFASFLAKLASTRIDKDRLCQIALILFRETFETIRPLGSLNKPGGPYQTILEVSIADLLPAACAWIREAGYNIILLSDVSWHSCSNTIGRHGESFIESKLAQRATVGFSPRRWMYWLKRLHEIRREAEELGEKQVVELASDAIEHMVKNVEERNPGILRVYEAAGDDLHQDEDLSGLMKVIKGELHSPEELDELEELEGPKPE